MFKVRDKQLLEKKQIQVEKLGISINAKSRLSNAGQLQILQIGHGWNFKHYWLSVFLEETILFAATGKIVSKKLLHRFK